MTCFSVYTSGFSLKKRLPHKRRFITISRSPSDAPAADDPPSAPLSAYLLKNAATLSSLIESAPSVLPRAISPEKHSAHG